MAARVLFAVDGSVPSRSSPTSDTYAQASARSCARSGKAGQVFRAKRRHWRMTCSPRLARSSSSEAQCWNVSTRVDVSPLSAAEVDEEVLRLAELLRPNLILPTLSREAPLPVGGGLSRAIPRDARCSCEPGSARGHGRGHPGGRQQAVGQAARDGGHRNRPGSRSHSSAAQAQGPGHGECDRLHT